jgi:hypothetical protein
MTKEPPIVIEDREELIFMLSEAAALEHMIMCEYLFAAFSLKRDVSEGVTAAQLEAIKGWERVVSLVATQEMLHLALVSLLKEAEKTHAEYEYALCHKDYDWATWYAEFIINRLQEDSDVTNPDEGT